MEKRNKKPIDLLNLTGSGFDLYVNGLEIAGGDIRINDVELQKTILKMYGFSEKKIREQFSALINALNIGVPVHGGFAIGLDRLTMMFANEGDIRTVLAFPSNNDNSSFITGNPYEPGRRELKKLGFVRFSDVYLGIIIISIVAFFSFLGILSILKNKYERRR
ncbi:MAG: hypothetical protein LBI29_02780 [Rickettsiales bacterium]|nr:hypothetical protein [Rickettsiales bacterium]